MKTAKEALLEEHSKDNRIKYITQEVGKLVVTHFWCVKPDYSNISDMWVGKAKDILKESLDPIYFDQDADKDKILFIDDILQKTKTELSQEVLEELTKCYDEKPIPKDTQLLKPPIGLLPKKIWLENRVKEINEAIKRYIDSNVSIDPNWIQERNEILEQEENEK